MRSQLLAVVLVNLWALPAWPADIAGCWDSDYGFVTLQTAPVKGKCLVGVTGFYVSARDKKGLIKSGTFDPATGVFEFAFEEPWQGDAKGTARLTLGADGKRFTGTYQQGSHHGNWTMTRVHGADFAARVDSIIVNADIKTDTPGAAVLVIEGGKVVFRKGYGLANFKDKKPITPRTTFELASCSKQFTGAAILILYEQGKLALDDDIRKYLPELPEYNRKNPIRILHLARHTSGLPEYMDFPNVRGKAPKFLSNEDYVAEFARQQKQFPVLFLAGAKHQYVNTNYMLLALIVERIAKKSFGAFLKNEVFDPLGMKTVTVYENPNVRPRTPALGYEKKLDKYEDIWGPPPFRHETLLTVGDGGVWASLDDLARWDAGWRQGKVLKPATLRLGLVPSKTRDGKINDYAFGWVLNVENGILLRMSHNGSWGGFETSVIRDLAEDRTIMVLSNLDSLDPAGIWGPVERLCWAMPPDLRQAR